jgi:hypothetical protein
MMMLRKVRWTKHVARVGQKRNIFRVLVRKDVGQKNLGQRNTMLGS